MRSFVFNKKIKIINFNKQTNNFEEKPLIDIQKSLYIVNNIENNNNNILVFIKLIFKRKK